MKKLIVLAVIAVVVVSLVVLFICSKRSRGFVRRCFGRLIGSKGRQTLQARRVAKSLIAEEQAAMDEIVIEDPINAA